MTDETRQLLLEWAETYNDPLYFQEDPIAFPTRFASAMKVGKACLQDVEVAAIFAAHFAWGRRAMIVRDCGRLFDEMGWKPYDYVMRGGWRNDDSSIHRTVKWSEIAAICSRLREAYLRSESIEPMNQAQMRTLIFGQKDGKVDLGIWKSTDPASLLIPLDVHVYEVAVALGLTSRKQKDIATVKEITDAFADIFPGDPCKGDFSLFGYGVTHPKKKA